MTTVLPPVAALELTYRCNHACRFCSCPWFAGMIKPSAEMSVDEWKRLIDEFAANGVRQFSFTGGEALMKEGCLDLVDFASKRALVNLLSNGRIVTDDVLRFCAERGIRLSVSMPGLKSFAENTDSDTPVEHILGVFARARDRRARAFSSRAYADGRGSARGRRCRGGSAFARKALRTFRNRDARVPHRRGQIRIPRDFNWLLCGNGVLHGRAERNDPRLQPQSGRDSQVGRVGAASRVRGVDAFRPPRLPAATITCPRCARAARALVRAWVAAAKRRVFSLVRRPPPTRFSPTE